VSDITFLLFIFDLGEYLNRSDSKKQKDEEECIMRNFAMCVRYQVLSGRPYQRA
jgi:hypothetical protein